MRIIQGCLSLLFVASLQPGLAGMTERVDPDGVTYFSPEQQPVVIVYGVPDCGYCRQARAYFAEQGIDYVEYNINKSSKRLEEFRRLGGRGTPLIRIDGKTIQGFNRRAIEAALNQ
jgi:glutaredoxin